MALIRASLVVACIARVLFAVGGWRVRDGGRRMSEGRSGGDDGAAPYCLSKKDFSKVRALVISLHKETT